MDDTDLLCVNTLRALSIDMVEAAGSGHPGLPLGAAPMMYALFSRHIRLDPDEPKWHGRDRFILSAGHGSALLYSMLHLCGFNVGIDDLKHFRQFGSITPGHPEYGVTDGVEATTGPLGQGFAMGVGMAIAEKTLSGCFNRAGHKPVDHYIYAIVSDGDLMEGVASEAASLAGTLKLGRLIYLYDDNDISIEGDTSLAFNENVTGRFEAYGWHVDSVQDGNDIGLISSAIAAAKEVKDRPSLIIVRTQIGYGSPKQGSASVHGEPLGAENVKKTKAFLGLDPDKSFHVPEEVKKSFAALRSAWKEYRAKKDETVRLYERDYPEESGLLEKYLTGSINRELTEKLEFFNAGEKYATRTASGIVMNRMEKYMTEFMGGSADLSPSTKTELKGYGSFGISGQCSRNIHFGVREHAMGAIVNGMALHGGIIPYGATFLVFSDYMRPAIRLAALMQCHSIFVFTHDSIGLGEDGPTHQPIEHINSLRMIPGLTVIRPADANETVAAWYTAIVNKKPYAIILSRQDLPVLDNSDRHVFEGALRGGYVVSHDKRQPDIILIATGSEVHIALEASLMLRLEGVTARVVSMPSWEIFSSQSREYRQSIIPKEMEKRIVIEAGSTLFFRELAGPKGMVMGIDHFGASAPGRVLMEKYGFTAEKIKENALNMLGIKKETEL